MYSNEWLTRIDLALTGTWGDVAVGAMLLVAGLLILSYFTHLHNTILILKEEVEHLQQAQTEKKSFPNSSRSLDRELQ